MWTNHNRTSSTSLLYEILSTMSTKGNITDVYEWATIQITSQAFSA